MSLYDKASLVQIPSGTKSGTLYSVLPANGDGDFTHTRASSATRVNKDGLIESVASGVPRLDYPLIDGVVQSCPALLLEPSRTNVQTYSEGFNNWSKTNVTELSNQTTSPDGNQTADSVKENSGVNSKYIYRISSVTSGNDYTYSVFVKYNGTRYVQLTGSIGFGTGYVNFDLENGTITLESSILDASITKYPNDWYRISVKLSCTLTTTSGRFLIALIGSANSGRVGSYSGDTSKGVYLWGAQLEISDYPTSYIPTTTASVTRSDDRCNSAGTIAEFNDSEGVLFAEIQGLTDTDTGNRYISLTDGTATNALMIQYRNSGELRLYNGGTSTAQMIYRDAGADLTQNIKVAIKYGTTTGSYKVYINGFNETIEGAFVATAMSGLDELKFEYVSSGNKFYGNTKQLMTFNEALTDSELEQVTSWTSFGEMAKGQLYTVY